MLFSARAAFRLRLCVVPLFLVTVFTLTAVGPSAAAPSSDGVTATIGVRN